MMPSCGDPECTQAHTFINEWHDRCLSEWGWVRDDSEWGIRHHFCDDDMEIAA